MATETPIKTIFRKQFAKDFLANFQGETDNYYFLYYGRVHSWDNDSIVPVTVDDFGGGPDAWNNMIGLQLIQERDLSLIIPRYNWTSGTTYTQYQDNSALFDDTCPSKFFVLNSDNRVYKCISNNKDGTSTSEPISTTTSIFQTEDGYKWKFMYQLSEDQKKFVTDEYIPVETLTGISYSGERGLQFDVQQKASSGSIEHIDITQEGTHWPQTVVANHYDGVNDFEVAQNVVVQAAAVGVNQVALNMKNILTYAGSVADIVGYSVYFYSGAGAGQYHEISAATTTDDSGSGLGYALITLVKPLTRSLSVAAVDISRFEILPTIKLYGNGSNAVAIPQMKETALNSSQYVIDSVVMVNSGKNYTVVRAEAVRGVTQLTIGSSLQTLLKPQISPPGGHGSSAETELGARDVMINVKTDGEVGGAISAVNDFRQFGVLKNPTIHKGNLAGKLAGDEQEERIRLRLIKPEQVIIEFDLNDIVGDKNYYPVGGGTNYDYVIGSEVTQEETGAKGVVVNWVPPVYTGVDPSTGAGDDLVGKLWLEVTVGTFLKQSRKTNEDGTVTAGLSIYSSVNNYPSYDKYNHTDIPFDVLRYTNETFDKTSFVLGTSSKATAEIVDWVVDEGGLSGFIYLKDVNGKFTIPRIDSETGKVLDGERIVQFKAVDNYTGIFNIANLNSEGNLETNSGKLGSDTSSQIIPVKAYKQSYVLQIETSSTAVDFVSGDFPKDSKITFKRGTTTLGTGYVVDFRVDTISSNATIEVTTVRDWDGEFLAGDTVTYIDTVGTIRTDTTDPTGTSPLITYPALTPDSGEMLYIQNILPVMRNTERSEEMKLLLRF